MVATPCTTLPLIYGSAVKTSDIINMIRRLEHNKAALSGVSARAGDNNVVLNKNWVENNHLPALKAAADLLQELLGEAVIEVKVEGKPTRLQVMTDKSDANQE